MPNRSVKRISVSGKWSGYNDYVYYGILNKRIFDRYVCISGDFPSVFAVMYRVEMLSFRIFPIRCLATIEIVKISAVVAGGEILLGIYAARTSFHLSSR